MFFIKKIIGWGIISGIISFIIIMSIKGIREEGIRFLLIMLLGIPIAFVLAVAFKFIEEKK